MNKSSSFVMQRPATSRTQFRHCASVAFSLGARLGLRGLTKNFHQAVRNNFVFAILKFPDRKAEAVRVARSASSAVFCSGTARSRIWIAPTHATRSFAHAPNSYGPGICKL